MVEKKEIVKTSSPRVDICQSHGELISLLMAASNREEGHAILLATHTKALDELLATQKEQGQQITEINKIVTNGLQTDIHSIKEIIGEFKKDLNKFMESTRIKIEEFDKFSWFGKGMNKFRDKFLLRLATGFLILIAILTVLHLSPLSNAIIKYITR